MLFRALCAVAALAATAAAQAQGTLERVAERGEFRIGYDQNALPLSFMRNGEPTGYHVEICRRIAIAVRERLRQPELKIAYVPITLDNRFDAIVDGRIDIECGSTTVTLSRHERVDFTLMTFVTGGAYLSMADKRLAKMADLAGKRVAVIRDTSTETALEAFLANNRIDARVVEVADSAQGMARLQAGEVDAYASDQIVLVGDALRVLEKTPNAQLSFGDELFSFEPYALMVRRNDADFRLLANRVIAELFRSGQFARLYQEFVGTYGIEPSPMLRAMYQVQALPE